MSDQAWIHLIDALPSILSGLAALVATVFGIMNHRNLTRLPEITKAQNDEAVQQVVEQTKDQTKEAVKDVLVASKVIKADK